MFYKFSWNMAFHLWRYLSMNQNNYFCSFCFLRILKIFLLLSSQTLKYSLTILKLCVAIFDWISIHHKVWWIVSKELTFVYYTKTSIYVYFYEFWDSNVMKCKYNLHKMNAVEVTRITKNLTSKINSFYHSYLIIM